MNQFWGQDVKSMQLHSVCLQNVIMYTQNETTLRLWIFLNMLHPLLTIKIKLVMKTFHMSKIKYSWHLLAHESIFIENDSNIPNCEAQTNN